jgi:hypothetical protein
MSWKAPRVAFEIAIGTFAVASLGGAVAFAVWQIAPAESVIEGVSIAGVAAVVVAALGAMVMVRIDRRSSDAMGFSVPTYEAAPVDEFRFETPASADDGILLLDDVIVPADPSRVVQLFTAAPPDVSAIPARLPHAGEMVARIEDFLRPARPLASRNDSGMPPSVVSDDAHVALHAALADIRRSLGKG